MGLNIGCINVNSFNISTFHTRNSKTFVKVEGVTQFKHDVLFLIDCRLNDKAMEVKRLFGLNRNASYKLYENSASISRGVAIAIKRNIPHEILEIFCSLDENVLLCKTRIKGVHCCYLDHRLHQ